jgi:hypothetical protein
MRARQQPAASGTAGRIFKIAFGNAAFAIEWLVYR